jgi:hypothetical protein
VLLNFGQPVDGIIQTAFVVEDIQVAMQHWIADLNVGPWFLLGPFTGGNAATYRGQPSRASVSIAMAFAGHMQIELLQPLDDLPSVYKETIEARGFGFHHHGLAVADIAAAEARYRAKGYEEAFRAAVGSGEVIYFDTKGASPGFIEIFEANAGMEDAFTSMYLASVGWHGEDPVRPFG